MLALASSCSVLVSLLFYAAAFAAPRFLMGIYTNDMELITFGSSYLRPLSVSFLAMGFSQMYLAAVKSTGNTRTPAIISSVSLISNVILDGFCIVVLFPHNPDAAVTAVALATVFSRFIETCWCFFHSRTGRGIPMSLPVGNEKVRHLAADFFHYTLPVQGNYLVWGCALSATAAIIGHVNADLVAANSIASIIRNLAAVLFSGIGIGGSILVGRYLGSGEMERARKAGNRITLYAFSFGVAAGLLILLMNPFLIRLNYLNEATSGYLNGMLLLSAVYIIGKALNSTLIGGIFPAGGDSRFGFWCDLLVMWGIVIPLGFASTFFWNFPPLLIYLVISLDEFIKLPAALIRYGKYRWLKNITREFDT